MNAIAEDGCCEIDFKFISQLSNTEVSKLKKLAFVESEFQRALKIRKKLPLSFCFIARTRTRKCIVGWLQANTYPWLHKPVTSVPIGIFVHRNYRNRGIGKQLVKAFEKNIRTFVATDRVYIKVNAHDDKSRGFWDSVGYHCRPRQSYTRGKIRYKKNDTRTNQRQIREAHPNNSQQDS